MKFGVYLKEQIAPEWADHYINYDTMKNTIKEMEDSQFGSLPNDGRLLIHDTLYLFAY